MEYYNSAGQIVGGDGFLNCRAQRAWRRYTNLTTPPYDAVKARVWLLGYGVAGWVAFDDVEFKATNSNTNLVTNGNFEGSGGWTKKWVTTGSNAKAYPATDFTSASTGVGAGRNGGSGYAISNLATGYIESAPVAVTLGRKYQIGAWLRGQLKDQAGQGDWRIRAQFYSASNVDLGYQNGCYGYGENTLTWHQVKCYVIPPQNAAKLRLQVWLVQHSGWVAVDDLTVDDLTVAGWDGSTKYYVFNGQRVAMRQGSKLSYLHTDHLGSTKLVTDQEGNAVQAPTQYYAYGREQLPNSTQGLPTDYTFTGQRQDNTGLIYMNARYYDPEVGQFISPDTLTPDASNVFDYNRYMYTRGNPLKHNDPSGHCVDGISTAICIGAAAGFLTGAGLYLWNESHQADGIDLSVNVSWQNGTPSVDFHDWGDFMTAGISGAAVGAMIPIGGAAAAIGTSAGGNLLADHMHNLLSGDDFSALNHAWTGVTGAATGMATLGANELVGPFAKTSSVLLNQVIRTGAKGVTAGIMDGFANNAQTYANTGKSDLASNLGGNILWDIAAEAFSSQIGGISPGWVEGDWNLAKEQGDAVWNAGLSFAWKYMETPLRVWLDQAQQLPSTSH